MQTAAHFSTLWIAALAVAGGLGALAAGGEMLISGAVRLAARLGMSPLLVGLTVVAFGTSLPELFVSFGAMLADHPGIMLGNVVGSNIANIGLVLGCAALIRPVAIHPGRMAVEFSVLTAAGILLLVAAAMGSFPRPLGLVFVAAIIAYTAFSCTRKLHAAPVGDSGTCADTNLAAAAARVAAGLIAMWLGSEAFIDGAVDIARHFGLSEFVIGLSLAAVGTSLPELASSVSAARRGEGDILVGNILGSNLFNLLLVLGLTGSVVPFAIPDAALKRDVPAMLAFGLVLVPMARFRGRVSRMGGLLLLAAYGAYIYLLGV